MKPLVVLSGPTAVGKTALSINLAKAVNGEIISADSMQVYRGMDIGTAKITPSEMDGVKHHLIDIIEPEESWSVTDFVARGKAAIEDIYSRGHLPIITGGTGFYIQALLKDVDFSEEEENYVRKDLEKLASEKGPHFIHELLKEVDPESADSIHENNVKRVIRALEYYRVNGTKISDHNKEQMVKESPYNYLYFVLNHNRDILYERIDKRIDIMLDDGLVDEVAKLKARGLDKSYISMQGLGYKEIYDFLNGDVSLEEAIYILKRDTRHFAKRQITWFKREKDVIWYDKSQMTEEVILQDMINKITSLTNS